ncbi:MAG: hypothetical protein M1821_004997 [Bathelium mastoideum]|nr:MAG: hypothetical protein M1821_004997 [Bathelium mastoideum]
MRYTLPSRLLVCSWHSTKGLVKRPKSQPLRFSVSDSKALPLDQKIEEEAYDTTSKTRYYPVQIGDAYEDKYQTVGKLGYGLGSTVWLANEFRGRGTVALKIFTNDRQNRGEIDIHKHLMGVPSQHPGRNYIWNALDTFTLHGPNGEHQCLVHEPMLESAQELLRRNPSHRFTEDLLRALLQHISAWNILLGIEDKSIVRKFIDAEQKHPSPRKELPGYTVYASRPFDSPSGKSVGEPLLSDFGSAVFGDVEHDEDVQPNVYRAPEIWDLFEGKHMFYGRDPVEKKYMTRAHLAEMIALMGPAPLGLLKKGKRTAEFFDEDGKSCPTRTKLYANPAGQWRGGIPVPDHTSLEESEERLEGSNKEAFLRFVRKMVQWRPEDRQTADQLLEDDWLNGRT